MLASFNYNETHRLNFALLSISLPYPTIITIIKPAALSLSVVKPELVN